MANYDTNRLNISLLEQYCSSFSSEKNSYNNTYNTFNSSYLNNCSDPYVQNISKKLKDKYNTIKNGYENINSWWTSYNSGAKALENKLKQDGINEFANSQKSDITASNNQLSPELLAMFPFLAALPVEEASKFQQEFNSYNTFLTTVDGTINDLQGECDYYHGLQAEYQSMVNDSGINVDMPDLSYEENEQLKKINAENLFNSFTANNSKNINLSDLDIKSQADLEAKVAALETDLNTAKQTKYYVKQLLAVLPYQYLDKCSDFADKSNYDAYKDIDLTNKTLDGEYLDEENINWLVLAKLRQNDPNFNSSFENNADIEWGKNCIPYYDKLQYLNDGEVNKYNYLFNVSGNETAEKYLTSLQDTLNQRQGAKEAIDFIQYLNNKDDVSKFFVTLGEGTKDGTITFFEGLENIVEADGVTSANQYKQMLVIQALSKKISDNDEEFIQLCKDYGVYEEVLGYTYKFGITVGNMAPTIAASVIMNAAATPALGASVASSLGQWTGTTLIGLSSAGNSVDYALSKGAEGYVASIYGILNGASEALLERYLGSIPGIGESARLSLKSMIKEGSEESFQQIIQTMLNKTMLGEDINLNDFGGQITESFMMGALMSGLMNGGQVVFNYAGQSAVVTIEKLTKFINEHNAKGFEEYLAKNGKPNVQVLDNYDEYFSTDYKKIVISKIDEYEQFLLKPSFFVKRNVDAVKCFTLALKDSVERVTDGKTIKFISDLMSYLQKNNKKLVIETTNHNTSFFTSFLFGKGIISLTKTVVDNLIYNTAKHEGAHYIDNCLSGGKVPLNFNLICENAIKKIVSIPIRENSLFDIMHDISMSQYQTENRAGDIWDKSDAYPKLLKESETLDISSLRKLLKEDKNLDEKIAKEIDNMSDDDIRNAYFKNEESKQISSLAKIMYESEEETSSYRAFSDIVSAFSKGKYYFEYVDGSSYIPFGHDEKYYSMTNLKGEKFHVWDEQYAQFLAIKLNGREDLLKATKDIFGEEWYNCLETRFNEQAAKISNGG